MHSMHALEDRWPAIIVGAGPVGLALALDLGRRGIRCHVLEQGDGSIEQPRMDMVSVRTMEFCRRWGLVEAVEQAGFPRDLPQDIAYSTAVLGFEMARDRMPCMAEQPLPPFSPQRRERCPQNFFDPVLARAAAAEPTVTLSYGRRVVDLKDKGEEVTVEVQDRNGARETLRAAWLAACDGAGSLVRRRLGIRMEGSPALTFSFNILFRSPELRERTAGREAYRHVLVDETGIWASVVAIDGRDVFRLQVLGDSSPRQWTEKDAFALVGKALGRPVAFEILSATPWVRRELVAERFQLGRCFLVGDAAHQMSPTGGYGMNTGIADAVDLSWKLAAVLEGWGGPILLASYDAERRPVAARNVAQASANLARMRQAPAEPEVLRPGPRGDAVRTRVAEAVAALMQEEWRSIGVHMGYRYDESPACWPEASPPPRDEVTSYTQTARPGARAPHIWLAEGWSTLDLFGDGFCLLDFGGADASGLVAAARSRGVPMSRRCIEAPSARALYDCALALIRPDGHVAWRGAAAPLDPEAVIDRIRGADAHARRDLEILA